MAESESIQPVVNQVATVEMIALRDTGAGPDKLLQQT